MYPPWVGEVTVRLTTTADTPAAGTPARPVIRSGIDPVAGTGARRPPMPSLVSSNRAGASEANAPAAVGVPAT